MPILTDRKGRGTGDDGSNGRQTMSITFFLSVDRKADAAPAVITARQLAAFRAFARERGQLLEDEDDDPLVSCSFEARVCPWSLASICAIFDHDVGVISVVEEAQFRGLNVRFWRDDATRTITMHVATTPDGASEINLANGNAYRVLDALRLADDNRGSIPITELRDTLGQPYVRRDLGHLNDGRYLERFDSLAAQVATSDEIRMVWG
ncbi:hypothetical protein PX554_21765 [Sphingomonas sp. H39-1-10]|uniref:hypothetical protein n=2 Tax=Alphaproteobacteria TaxID=28211 RepID=UPI0023B9F831|nr:hypothetical protein [Sphingomonas pollutisoli]MDF0490763.1 hypothetical protein [Sphingomonas pollutisoli]